MTNQEIINGLLKLRKQLCTGPCGASCSIQIQREDRYKLLTETINFITHKIKDK